MSRVLLASLLAPALALWGTDAAAAPVQPGVNLAGCAVGTDGALCPSAADVNQYVSAGFTMFRIGFKGSVPTPRIMPAVDAALAQGATVLLDRHEYKWPSVDEQVDFWTSRFAKYKGNMRVVFDLMNEPRGFSSSSEPNDYYQWIDDTREIIKRLREKGFTNPIAVEWPQYSAIYRFDLGETAQQECVSAGCAIDRRGGFGDKDVILSPHIYLDKGSVGQSAVCGTNSYTAKFADQVRKRGLRAILGETAFGNYSGIPAGCAEVGRRLISDMISAPDVFIGYTIWGGGREWPSDYIFAIAPKGQSLDSEYARALLGR